MKAYQIMEEIINEVSVNKWKEAAKNSIEGRKAKAEEASDRFGSVVYPFRPEVNDPGHKLANAWDKAEQRADRAEQLAKNLPNSNRSANELKNAAKKVIDKRDKDNEEAVDKLQNAVDTFKEKSYDERTDKDYSDLAKVQNEWVNKQKKENRARNLVGKPERRPEKNSEGKHKLKEQGYIDRTNEALDIMEEIINEVSIGMWKKAAANSLPKRQEEAEVAKKAAEQGWEEYDKQARKHPEEEPALYRLAQANDEAGVKSEERAEHAKDVSKLMVHNKANANKAIKAAKKVSAKREDTFGGAPSAKTLKRSVKANQLVYADPNYKNEALGVNEDKEAALSQLRNEYDKEAENIPNGSKEMYELNKKYGKLKKKVDKHFDKNEALELAEAIINEFTEADKKEAAKKVLPERKREYLSKYADVLDAADEVGSENVPDGNLKDLERAEKRYKHAEKVANEALSLAESIIGYADNIFELDYENKQNVNTNKIRKLKKDKDGENVEVVSVADELFPYEGNAKQQFNQKVLAKINDMIEGKGSLEDLIQFVRKYSGNKKATNENTEISEEGKEPNKECEYRKAEWEKASNNYFETKKKHLDWEGKHPETKKAYEEERKAYANLDKARRDSKKINGLYEALEEIKQVVEGLFVNDGRGDLLNDIDNALGSPVKKTAKDMVKQCTGCKQKKVK